MDLSAALMPPAKCTYPSARNNRGPQDDTAFSTQLCNLTSSRLRPSPPAPSHPQSPIAHRTNCKSHRAKPQPAPPDIAISPRYRHTALHPHARAASSTAQRTPPHAPHPHSASHKYAAPQSSPNAARSCKAHDEKIEAACPDNPSAPHTSSVPPTNIARYIPSPAPPSGPSQSPHDPRDATVPIRCFPTTPARDRNDCP